MRNAEAWPGFDFLTIDTGINPLVAGYTGAPSYIRGTDDASYGRAARDFFGADIQAGYGVTGFPPNGETPDGTPVNAVVGLPDWIPGAVALNNFGKATAGFLVALVLIIFGLYVFTR